MAVANSLNPTREDFAALLEESFASSGISEGTVVKGKVINVEKDIVLIDVGLKMEGRVPLREFAQAGREAKLNPGDSGITYQRTVWE